MYHTCIMDPYTFFLLVFGIVFSWLWIVLFVYIFIHSSQEEKDKWIEDLNEAIISAKNRNDDKLKYASLKSSTSKCQLLKV